MKLKTFLILGIFLHMFFSCDSITNIIDNGRIEIEFEIVEGYFVSNKYPLPSSTNFLIIENQTLFDSIFIPVPPPYDQSEITEVNLDDSFIAAIIKYGNSYWTMEATNLYLDDSLLVLEYKAECVAESLSWTPAVPHIVMFKDIPFYSVSFVENGSFLGEVIREGK